MEFPDSNVNIQYCQIKSGLQLNKDYKSTPADIQTLIFIIRAVGIQSDTLQLFTNSNLRAWFQLQLDGSQSLLRQHNHGQHVDLSTHWSFNVTIVVRTLFMLRNILLDLEFNTNSWSAHRCLFTFDQPFKKHINIFYSIFKWCALASYLIFASSLAMLNIRLVLNGRLIRT